MWRNFNEPQKSNTYRDHALTKKFVSAAFSVKNCPYLTKLNDSQNNHSKMTYDLC